MFVLIRPKDSLWQAEDIEAVFDQDPQRVCILQGPVAAKHSKVKDEPIADLLGGIVSNLADKVLERYYGGDVSKIPTIDYLGNEPSLSMPLKGAACEVRGETTTCTIGSNVPSSQEWLEALAGNKLSWLRAILTTPSIVQGTSYIANPIQRLFAPRAGQKVVLQAKRGVPSSITVFGSARSYGKHQEDFKSAEVVYDDSTRQIHVTLFEERRGASVPLRLIFQYRPDMGCAPIHEVNEGRNQRIKDFYWKLWFGDDSTPPKIDVRQVFKGPIVTIEPEHIEKFCSVVGNDGEAFKKVRNDEAQAPMDFAIVTGWQVCTLQVKSVLTYSSISL